MTTTIRAFAYNLPAPGANANIFATDLTPRGRGRLRTQTVKNAQATYFVLTIAPTNTTLVDLYTTNGATTFRTTLNQSNPVIGGTIESFKIPVHPSLDYNFSIQTNGILRQIEVREQVQGAA